MKTTDSQSYAGERLCRALIQGSASGGAITHSQGRTPILVPLTTAVISCLSSCWHGASDGDPCSCPGSLTEVLKARRATSANLSLNLQIRSCAAVCRHLLSVPHAHNKQSALKVNMIFEMLLAPLPRNQKQILVDRGKVIKQ